jgi:hypothetical protein
MATNQADIDYLLSKIARKIQSGQTRTEQTRTGQTAQENPPAGADDQYWIDLKDKNDFTSDEIIQIKTNYNNKSNLSGNGRKARRTVMVKIKD